MGFNLMSHKDAPPLSDHQVEFERIYQSLHAPGDGIAMGRGRDGGYLAASTQQSWRLWQQARAFGRLERERELLAMQNRRGSG